MPASPNWYEMLLVSLCVSDCSFDVVEVWEKVRLSVQVKVMETMLRMLMPMLSANEFSIDSVNDWVLVIACVELEPYSTSNTSGGKLSMRRIRSQIPSVFTFSFCMMSVTSPFTAEMPTTTSQPFE